MVWVIKLNNNSKDSYYLHILDPDAIIWFRATVVRQTFRLKSCKVATESLIAAYNLSLLQFFISQKNNGSWFYGDWSQGINCFLLC